MSRKDTQLQVRLSEQDKQTIAARAKAVGMSTSEFVRQMALLAAVFEVPAYPEEVVQAKMGRAGMVVPSADAPEGIPPLPLKRSYDPDPR